MQLHEFQAKDLFRRFGVNVLRGTACTTADQAAAAARSLGSPTMVVKAQIHAGAIVSGGTGTAAGKLAAMRDAGVLIAESPATLGETLLTAAAQR
jgi:succinyl-CoA synthetase beta subunit